MFEYKKRIADQTLATYLRSVGAVLIEGPKWCGKTTTAEQQAASVVQLQDPDKRLQYDMVIKTKPSILLEGETPRLIDEWQVFPVLWDAVRTMVDKNGIPGQFILTGSNSIKHDEISHSGTGRIGRMKMLPMSLYESGDSNGKISLKDLFDNPELKIDGITSGMTIKDLIFAACRGGWPAAVNFSDNEAQLFVARNYLESVCNTDVVTIDGIRRDPTLVRTILRSYARNISTLAKKKVILDDVKSYTACTENTLNDYLNALQRLFVIEDIPAWNPSIRSASAIRASLKRQFVDPSIAVAALSASPQQLLSDLNAFGFIFETMCCRDLRVYSASLGGALSYYHDRSDLEVDAVLHLSDGRFALIEIKLGAGHIEEGAAHLLEIVKLIDKANEKRGSQRAKLRKPDLLMVLTGSEIAYRRPDGVCVVPLGCLKD